jgi:chromosome transmission fidelity protein 1
MAHSNLDESASEFNSIHVLQPPTTFSFPFEPYDIQKQFMEQMYRVLEDGKIGLFESPTGTGKSLSIICSCLRWLMDHQERENRRMKALLAGDVSALLSGDGSQNPSDPSVPDWFVQYDQQKKLKDEIYRLERVSKKKEQRERRIKDLKEKFGTSLIKKSHHAHDTKHMTLESIQYQFENPQTDLEHDDIILNEYHSDNDITSDSSSDSDSDIDTEETLKVNFLFIFLLQSLIIQIFYTSRTHSQLSQFLHEVLKTPYKDMVSVIPLGSRQTYCLNKSVMRLQWQNLINDRCLELQKNKKKCEEKEG